MKARTITIIKHMAGILLLCLLYCVGSKVHSCNSIEIDAQICESIDGISDNHAPLIKNVMSFTCLDFAESNSVRQQQNTYSRTRTNIDNSQHYRFYRLHNRFFIVSNNKTYCRCLKLFSFVPPSFRTSKQSNEYYIYALRKLLI